MTFAMATTLTPEDMRNIRNVLLPDIETLLAPRFFYIESRFEEIERKIDGLTSSVDQFLHTSRRHDDELVVLRAQSGRIRNVLVEKGVASEDELSVLGKSPPLTPPGRGL